MAEEFQRANGLKYVRFLRFMHKARMVNWYLEVGCRTGRSFAEVASKTIAVDPFFRIETNVIHQKPALFTFQMTSDDFFANDILDFDKIKIDLAFLDGMHLFEYLLRDFIETEKRSHKNGVILLHDCCPFNYEMTTRDLDISFGLRAWTGDVWKLIPILKDYRPDLTVRVLDARPTGLVLIENLDPKNKNLSKYYDKILEEYSNLELEDFGLKRFNSYFQFESAREIANQGFQFLEKVAIDPETHITPEQVTP